MTKLITVEQFRKDARAHREPRGPVFRISTEMPKALDDGSRVIRFCFSDGAVDRMGDTIDPNGWDLTDFSRNPVALWAHDSSAPPIGRAANVGPEGQRLMGDIEFAPPEAYPFAETIFQLTRGGFLNAVSVGFLPIEFEWSKDDDREWGIDFLKQSLLEISVCPIPANPNALGEARAKGIDTRPLVEWAEHALDGGGKVIIPKAELERLRKAAKEPPMAKRPTGHRLRATGASEDDPASGGALVANCGRRADEGCGLINPAECSIHGGGAEDPEEEKRLRRMLQRLLAPYRKGEDEPDGDELPLAHHDAVRMAHKCLRTSKAFLAEAVIHHTKAVDLLGGVVEALDDDGTDDEPAEPKEPDDEDVDTDDDKPVDDPDEKAAHLRRIAALRRRINT